MGQPAYVVPSTIHGGAAVLSCPFCQIESERVVSSNQLAVAIRDLFPVNLGHTLVITRRHVASWFEATPNPPVAYNIGINIGQVAGQTVMHLHVHLIPRYRGDVADPRGGVRHVVPERGNYLLTQEGGE